MKVKVKSCPTLCDPMDCSLPDSSICGIFQARVLEWVAISPLGVLSTQGSNPGFLHCRQTLYRLSQRSNFFQNGMSDILWILAKPQTSFNLLVGCKSVDFSPFLSVCGYCFGLQWAQDLSEGGPGWCHLGSERLTPTGLKQEAKEMC